jgi:RNA recognition motif-containing protein
MSDVQATPSTQQAAAAVQDTSGFKVPPSSDPPGSHSPTVHKVFAGNLPYSVTDESLKAFFAPIANDMSVLAVLRQQPSFTLLTPLTAYPPRSSLAVLVRLAMGL